jgi:hypothetical protein
MSRFNRVLAVYRHDPNFHAPLAYLDAVPYEECVPLDERTVPWLFDGHGKRVKRFQGFLKDGFSGVALVRDGRCTSFGWFSQPGTSGPEHLPRWIRDLDSYWVFHAHTATDMRGQGCFTRVLGHIVEIAKRRHPAAFVYADTDLDNVSSRRAMLSAGFTPNGVIRTYRLTLPCIGNVITKGSWRRSETHPLIVSIERPLVPCDQPASGSIELT